MLQKLADNYIAVAAVILFGIGFTTLLLHKNLIKKVIGFSFMDSAIFLFLAAQGYVKGGTAPILDPENLAAETSMINPIPAGLVLTGIVVSVSVSALMLALTVRLYRRYHTLDFDEICRLYRKEES